GGIEEAIRVGLTPVKINAVLVGGFNDDEIKELVDLTYKGIDVRFIELMPIGEGVNFARENFISNDEVLKRVGDLTPIEREDKSSPAKYYKLPGVKGKVGLINPISCKFCDDCNRVRITSTGRLKSCLHSNNEIDLITPLRNGLDMEKIIRKSIFEKEEGHELENDMYIDRNMNQIGG
ncbi:MAG: GTP 3',8-cyclase MoaA, partial [Tissierella sp.]